MSDSLSIVAAVAGLVGLAGTVSKQIFQFLKLVADALASARRLASVVSSVLIALGQVQDNLMNPKFRAEADNQDLRRLEFCLGSCTLAFDEIRGKIDLS